MESGAEGEEGEGAECVGVVDEAFRVAAEEAEVKMKAGLHARFGVGS